MKSRFKNINVFLACIMLVVLVASLLALPQKSSAEILSVDTVFGGDGIVTYYEEDFDSSYAPYDQIVDQDGLYVVVGDSSDAASGYVNEGTIWRYRADGTLDPAFGIDGIMRFENLIEGAISMNTSTIAQDSQGRYYVSGTISITYYDDPFFTYDTAIFVMRLNNNGSTDTTYGGGDGFVLYEELVSPEIENFEFVKKILITSDDKLIVVGGGLFAAYDTNIYAIRLGQDGNLDPSFGISGKFVVDVAGFDEVYAAELDLNERIVIVGYSNPDEVGGVNHSQYDDMLLLRVTSDGGLDTSFNGVGYVTHNNAAGGDDTDRGVGVSVTNDNGLFVVGSSEDGTTDEQAVFWLYNEDGTLDTDFNGTGFMVRTLEGSRVFVTDSTQVIDGRVLSLSYNDNGDFLIWVVNLDGTLDTENYPDGYYTIPLAEGIIGPERFTFKEGKILTTGSGNVDSGIICEDGDPDCQEGSYFTMAVSVLNFAYEIENLDASLATLVGGEETHYGYGDEDVVLRASSDDATLAAVDTQFATDLDWSIITGDSVTDKAFVHGLPESPGAASTFSLYIPRLANATSVYVCPGADSLEEIVVGCAGGYELLVGDPNLTTETIDGVEYFVIAGITGTGAVNVLGALAPTGMNFMALLGGVVIAAAVLGAVSFVMVRKYKLG